MPPEGQAAPIASPAPVAPAAPAADAGAGAEKSWEEIRNEAVAADEKANPPAKGKDKPRPGTEEPPKERKPKYSEWQSYEHKLANVNKRDKAVTAREQEGARSVEALNKRTTELDARAKQLDTLETDPKAFIEHFAKRVGMTPTKVVNALNEYFLENKSPADLEIAKLRQEQKERDERQETEKKTGAEKAAQAAREAKVNGYKSSIAKFVTDNADKYDFLPTYPPDAVANAAWARIEAHFQKTGKNIPLDKMLATLESEEEAQFLQKEERRKKRLSAGAQQVSGGPNHEGVAPATNRDEQQRPSTLNHRLAGQRSPQARGASDQDDWEESKRLAGVVR